MNGTTVFCQKDNILGHTVFKLILPDFGKPRSRNDLHSLGQFQGDQLLLLSNLGAKPMLSSGQYRFQSWVRYLGTNVHFLMFLR